MLCGGRCLGNVRGQRSEWVGCLESAERQQYLLLVTTKVYIHICILCIYAQTHSLVTCDQITCDDNNVWFSFNTFPSSL